MPFGFARFGSIRGSGRVGSGRVGSAQIVSVGTAPVHARESRLSFNCWRRVTDTLTVHGLGIVGLCSFFVQLITNVLDLYVSDGTLYLPGACEILFQHVCQPNRMGHMKPMVGLSWTDFF